MLVVEVFTGQKPFGRSAYDALACLYTAKGKRPEKPVNDWGLGFSDGIWGLVQRCWAQDPDDRPIVDDVVKAWGRLMNNQGGFRGPEVSLNALTRRNSPDSILDEVITPAR